jgi:hypothetical protein
MQYRDRFLLVSLTDIICCQEVRPENLAILDDTMSDTHDRVRPPNNDVQYKGWTVGMPSWHN